MSEFSTDKLILRGRLQVEIAIGALAHSGINPQAQQRLQTFLDVHRQHSNGENQNDLSVYLQGDTVQQEKADIIASLDKLAGNESVTPEARIAAVALREIL